MSKKVKIMALLPLLRFGFPHSDGQVLEVEAKQAEEMIEAGYAKKHDPKLEKAQQNLTDATKAVDDAKIFLEALPEDAASDVREKAEKDLADAEDGLVKAEEALAKFEV